MDWEICHIIQQAELISNEEEGEAILLCQVPEAAEHFKKLLDGASQAAIGFDGGTWEGESVIGFQLRNANGQFYLALLKKDWELLLEQPDEIAFVYGEGEKDRFQLTFLNGMFESFLDQEIERYNEGGDSPFHRDLIEIFAEED